MRFALLSFVCVIFFVPTTLTAATLHEDLQGIWRAEVVEVVSERIETLPGLDTEALVQIIRVKLLEGSRVEEVVELRNDRFRLRTGQVIYLNYLRDINGVELFTIREVDRRSTLAFWGVLLVAAIIFFGRVAGLRSLLALAGSLLIIGYILLPKLLAGYDPVILASAVGIAVLAVAIGITHGISRLSLAAFLGTAGAVVVSGFLASLAISMNALTGFATDESVYLNFATTGSLDFAGLLLAAIIIGALGVLDDVAVTQASVVRELYATDPSLLRREALRRAMRVGREHVGALVNTLALAYTGAALPLLLLFSTSDAPLDLIVNQEVFATEIIRTVVGSLGLVLAVPLTTALGALFLHPRRQSSKFP